MVRDVGAQDVRADTTSVTARVTVPLYQSGSEYSLVRQRKETANQRRVEVDKDALRQLLIARNLPTDRAHDMEVE